MPRPDWLIACCCIPIGWRLNGFAGDKRSFAMVKIAAHRLAGEKRKGWAAVNVVAEMCEALVRRAATVAAAVQYGSASRRRGVESCRAEFR